MGLLPAIEPSRVRVEPNGRAKDQFCVPAVVLEGESYRKRQRPGDPGSAPRPTRPIPNRRRRRLQ